MIQMKPVEGRESYGSRRVLPVPSQGYDSGLVRVCFGHPSFFLSERGATQIQLSYELEYKQR